MSKTVNRAKSAVKGAAKSQAVPAVLVGLAGVAVLGYFAGKKGEDLLEGFSGSLGFGGSSEGAGAKTSESTSIVDKVIENITESVKSTTKGTGDAIINAGGTAVKTAGKTVIAVPSAVYQGASESLKIEPSTVQTSKTKAAITARTETGQAWSLAPASTEQLSKYVGTPGNVVSNWLEQGTTQDLSGKGDTFSEYTQAEKSASKYVNPETISLAGLLTGSYAGSKKSTLGGATGQVMGGSGSTVSDLIKDSNTSAAAMNTTVKNTYGATTLGNLTAQVNLLNTGNAAGNKAKKSTASAPAKTSATSTYKESGQTKYKDTSGKTHVVVKR